jgi:hypothetical protein
LSFDESAGVCFASNDDEEPEHEARTRDNAEDIKNAKEVFIPVIPQEKYISLS